MPSVDDIFTVADVAVGTGVDVGSGVDVNGICVGTGVSDGTGVDLIVGAVGVQLYFDKPLIKNGKRRGYLFLSLIAMLLNQLQSPFVPDLQKIWD